MDKIQLIFFFINGFLISRLFIKAKLPERIVQELIVERSLSVTKVVCYIVALSAFFSFFIPNAITVLTLIPVLVLFRRVLSESGASKNLLGTMFTLAVIYGANIGGMGSITATPANGILATALVINDVPYSEKVTFASWLLWGIPLVIVFVAAACGILIVSFRTWRFNTNKITLKFDSEITKMPHRKMVVWLTAAYFISSISLSGLMTIVPDYQLLNLIFTVFLSIVFIIFIFFFPLRPHDEPLLRVADCYSNLPMRGFLFVGIAVVLGGVMYLLNVGDLLESALPQLIPHHLPNFLLLICIAGITSFSTEALSNTVVQIAMFILINSSAGNLDLIVLEGMIVATLASTSAFMSPIATGVNGLAFGSMKGVSITQMVIVGFIMNIVGAILVSVWASYVIGWLYGI